MPEIPGVVGKGVQADEEDGGVVGSGQVEGVAAEIKIGGVDVGVNWAERSEAGGEVRGGKDGEGAEGIDGSGDDDDDDGNPDLGTDAERDGDFYKVGRIKVARAD